MGTIKVKARVIGVKPGEVVGYFRDERVYQGDVIEISDAPKFRAVSKDGDETQVMIPGSVAAFSDNKRKKWPGWMEFVDAADEKKYRAGGFNPAGSAPAEAPAPAAPPAHGKPEGKPGKPAQGSGEKNVL